MTPRQTLALGVLGAASLASCARPAAFTPSEVVDLGAVVTDDLPQRMWGSGLLKAMNFAGQNSAEVVKWTLPVEGGGTLAGQNSYYTLFNHGGPHVDAPIHVSAGGGIDAYSPEAFSGTARVFDVGGIPARSFHS